MTNPFAYGGYSSEEDNAALAPAQDALNRMRRADQRGTGCHLTAEMIAGLAVTVIGEMWEHPDPRGENVDEIGGAS